MKNKIIVSLMVFGLSMQCMQATILPGAQTHDEILRKLSKTTKTTGMLESLISDFQKQCEKSKSKSFDFIKKIKSGLLYCSSKELNQGLQDSSNDHKEEA